MAVTVSTIAALEQAAQSAGKPAFLGANALRSYVTPAEWSTALTWTTGGAGGGTNQSRPYEPPRWVHDGRLTARSRPNVAAVSSYYLLFDLDGSVPLDAAVVGNHNFADIVGCQVRLGVADDAAYTTNRRTIAEWTNFGTSRLVALDLTDGGPHGAGEHRSFEGVQYAYLEVTTSGTFLADAPRVGEIFLGRARRFARAHNYPGDSRAIESRVDEHEADGGGIARYVRHHGRRMLDLAWTADSEDELGDDLARWRALFEDDLEDGTLPAFYVRDPATPEDAPLVLLEPVQRFEYLGPHHASREISGRELPPFVRTERPPTGPAPATDSLFAPWSDWIVGYSSEAAGGAGPYSWPPSFGSGPTLATVDAYSGGVVTSPLLSAGIGPGRVDEALSAGGLGFAGSFFDWPAGAVHMRALFRPVGEVNGARLFAWTIGGATDLVAARFTSSTNLSLIWQDTTDGAVYSYYAAVTNDTWNLLDFIVYPTGGSGGVSRMYVYVNGSELATADHSVAIQPEGSGYLGVGCDNAGNNAIAGSVLSWGLRPATGINLVTHQAHAASIGV